MNYSELRTREEHIAELHSDTARNSMSTLDSFQNAHRSYRSLNKTSEVWEVVFKELLHEEHSMVICIVLQPPLLDRNKQAYGVNAPQTPSAVLGVVGVCDDRGYKNQLPDSLLSTR